MYCMTHEMCTILQYLHRSSAVDVVSVSDVVASGFDVVSMSGLDVVSAGPDVLGSNSNVVGSAGSEVASGIDAVDTASDSGSGFAVVTRPTGGQILGSFFWFRQISHDM